MKLIPRIIAMLFWMSLTGLVIYWFIRVLTEWRWT